MTHQLVETFEKNSSELYWLAYLLTGNVDHSVQAFDRALDVEDESNPTFGEFMNDWARKLIIVEALRTIANDVRTSILRVARTTGDELPGKVTWTQRPHIAKEDFEEAVIAIDTFPRCAMLLTIFEGMSVHSASILLGASEPLVKTAQRIGIVQLTRNLAGRDPHPASGHNPVPVLSLG